jgi:hypothetical protein
MSISTRQCTGLVVAALVTCGLGGCGTINGYLAAGLSDVIPKWAGGLPADAPPRPGTAKYDEFMREQEEKRLRPAPEKPADSPGIRSSMGAVH